MGLQNEIDITNLRNATPLIAILRTVPSESRSSGFL